MWQLYTWDPAVSTFCKMGQPDRRCHSASGLERGTGTRVTTTMYVGLHARVMMIHSLEWTPLLPDASYVEGTIKAAISYGNFERSAL